MTKAQIVNGVTRSFYTAKFQLMKHSPEILIAAGVIGVVASGVMACKATLKVHEVTEKAKTDMGVIHEAGEKGVTPAGEEYSQEDVKRDTTIVYAQAGVKIVKMYAPAVILGALSLTAIIASNNILRKRNVALAAAYTAVDKGFKEYRGRVVERFGEAVDRELRYDIKAKEIEKQVIDENGNETVEKEIIEVYNPDALSLYDRIYDDGCIGWSKSPEANKDFLFEQMAHANERLKREGYLFLSDVYEMLGFPITAASRCVGWTYNNKKAKFEDGYVSFGIADIHNEKKRDFINGYERNIILSFNVQGDILHLL